MKGHAKERSVGDRLDELMQASPQFRVRGQSALARASGVKQPTINRILNNKSDPESENVRKLANVFGVTFEWLMSERGPKYVVDLAYTEKDGNRVSVEAKRLPLSANSAITEEFVNTSTKGNPAAVNNDLDELLLGFIKELREAHDAGRISEELIGALKAMLGAMTKARKPPYASKTKNIGAGRNERGTRKRGTGTG
ncbi:helix-turn-helix domain-containing protein [Trinickia mobilis]|uniref:helix-turn-helix domain-containing protein n=1 Tax=Trinickia mobilis TaxID=2816356 RepID=UPI001A906C85|nr:helix-turn-helix transcriptional regulator [Trinickia mobilis]